MITFRRFLMQFAAAAVLLAVLAGCGDDDGGEASPDTTEAASPDDVTDETLPPDTVDDGDGDGDADGDADTGGRGTISAFTVEVQSPASGIDLTGEVTAAQVAEDNDPLSTWIVCSAVEAPDPSSFAGYYFITVLMRNNDEGITSFGVEALGDVDGPGTYDASFRVGIAGRPLLETKGDLTLDADMGGGTVTGTTPEGGPITATYRCNT